MADLDWLDSSASAEKTDFQTTETQNVLVKLASDYSLLLAKKLNSVDAVSSGELADSIQPLSIQINGDIFYVDIVAAKYASFIDEGVDGWANSRGSRFKFKTKGVDPQGEMVKSIKAYLVREGKMNTKYAPKYAITKKEIKGAKITDVQIKQAASTAYMIKRFGIKATHFWRDATSEFQNIIEKELGMAVKVDIINTFTK